jgi:alpha-tubulin suppressor-like RCC1 family protein
MVWEWGAGVTPSPQKVNLPDGIVIQTVIRGDNHSMAIDADFKLWVWGSNSFGEVGDGTTNSVFEPKIIELD